MQLLLGIDLGTSYFKIGLFDPTGCLHGLARLKVDTVSCAPHWVELPVQNFWALLRRGLAQALKEADASQDSIVGISYSSQANTFLVLDQTAAPITPLILWTDQRTPPVPHLESFSASIQFGKKTGFVGMGPQWAPSKLHWIRHNAPDSWKRTRHIKTISDYFCYGLTGSHVGDAGTAAFLGLFDLHQHSWWPDALDAVGVSMDQLSKPLRPGTVIGTTSRQACDFLGLPSGIPVCAGGLDHQVAALGSGLGTKSDASISTGTVLAAMRLVKQPAVLFNCYHGPSFTDHEYYRLAFNPNGAGRLERMQNSLCPHLSIGEMIAAALPDYADNGPRADLYQQVAKDVRALLYEIAHDHLKLLQHIDPNLSMHSLVATGGGSRSIPWLRLKADLFKTPILTPRCPERACLGAAMLAARAAGLFDSLQGAVTAMASWNDPILPRQ